MDADRIKHLEFIQNNIARMNSDSFQVKNWSLVMLAALVTVFATTGSWLPLAVAMVATLLFWVFDAYFLYMETLYRDMYKEAIKEGCELPLWELSPHSDKFKRSKGYWDKFFSKTVGWLYLTMIALTGILIMLVIKGVLTVNI